jgi:hypothetical protein
MDSWKLSRVEVLPAVSLQELDITSVVDSAIDQHQPALAVVLTVAQQDALLSPRVEVTNLELHRQVHKDLAAPDLDVADIWDVTSEDLPGGEDVAS